MSTKIASCRHELQNNSVKTSSHPRPWRGRAPSGRGFTITPNANIDYGEEKFTHADLWGLTILRSHAHNETGQVQMSRAEFAGHLRMSDSTARRRLEKYEDAHCISISREFNKRRGTWDAMIITVLSPAERKAKLKTVENKGKDDPTPGVKIEPIVLINTSSQTEILNPPTPQRGESVCGNEPKPEPQRPQPSSEVYESERHFRELRRQRKAESRSTRHREAREERRSRPGRCAGQVLTAFQRAALEVMSLCGVAGTSWRVRDGIAAAISLHVEGCGHLAGRAVEPMVIAWRDYLDDHPLLRCPLGMESFFVSGTWKDRRQWRYDQDALKRLRRW
jgi:hypothetical protein